jgi:hypothetical protein
MMSELRTLDKHQGMFIYKRKPTLSLERILHKDYDRKGSTKKISGRET